MFANVSNVLSLVSGLHQAKSKWDKLDIEERSKLDTFIDSLANIPQVSSAFPEATALLVDREVPLPERLVSVFKSKDVINARAKFEHGEDSFVLIRCRQCGETQDLDLPREGTDFSQLAGLASTGKSIFDKWKDVPDGAQSILDDLVRLLADQYLESDDMQTLRVYLSTNPDPLGTRLVGALLYPGAKDYVLGKAKTLFGGKYYLPQDLESTCRFCGHTDIY